MGARVCLQDDCVTPAHQLRMEKEERKEEPSCVLHHVAEPLVGLAVPACMYVCMYVCT